jgi:mannose-6-phosphate isomerase-like protein (cupin superfamily)
MSYPGERGEISAIHLPVDAVPSVTMRTGTTARFVARGSLTNGRYGLFRWDMPGGAGGPDPHFHRTFSESFFALSGVVGLYDGSQWVQATAGDFLYVPEGGIHAFHNAGEDPASMLILFAPGIPREEYFEALAEIGAAGRELSPDEWTELYARHDQFMV